jgi:C4-dicarboxylate transporter DctM subunit
MTTISDRPVDEANPAALTQRGLFARAFGLRPRSSALDYLAIANELLVVAALTLALTLTFANTIARYAFNAGITWAPDLILICMAMMAFPGAAAFFRLGDGMAYNAVVDLLKPRARDTLRAVGMWMLIVVCAASLVVFPAFFRSQLIHTLPVLDVSYAFVSVWFALGLFLMIVFTAEKMRALSWTGIVAGLAIVLVVGVLTLVVRSAFLSGAIDIDPFWPILLIIVTAFFAAMPVAFVLAVGGILYFFITGDAPMVIVPATYQAGIGGFVLLSIPFFMLAGSLMDITGMANRLITTVQEWVGHRTGGLLVAEVCATYVFSGVSGTKAADVATIGGVMKKPMRERGYPATEFAAVLAASAAMAETVPPSVAMLILGSVTSLSVGALFVAGFLPAAILAISLIIAVIIRSKLKRFPKGDPFNLRRALASIPPALPALGIPVIVVGGLVGGVASPTESASFAVVYGLAAALIVHRSITANTAWVAVRDATLISGMVLVMIATANLLVQAIVIDGLGRSLASAFSVVNDPTLFLFVSVAALIVLGFVLEGFPAILVAAPILLPIAERIGVDSLQFGILLIMAIGVGIMMPPVGLGFYITCAVCEAPVNATMKPSFVYNLFLILGLVVVIMFPQITLWLPHLFGLH